MWFLDKLGYFLAGMARSVRTLNISSKWRLVYLDEFDWFSWFHSSGDWLISSLWIYYSVLSGVDHSWYDMIFSQWKVKGAWWFLDILLTNKFGTFLCVSRGVATHDVYFASLIVVLIVFPFIITWCSNTKSIYGKFIYSKSVCAELT